MKIVVTETGDTLEKLAAKYHVSVSELQLLNQHIKDPSANLSGKIIKLPSGYTLTASAPPIPTCQPGIPTRFLDHWIPLTPIEKMAQTEYDVLIVGTGAGGGAMLWRLCEQWGQNDKKIGILEAGDLLVPTHARNLPTMEFGRFYSYLFNPAVFTPYPHLSSPFHSVRKLLALGGRTLFWGVISPRMGYMELQNWPIPYPEMDYYYRIAEKVMNVSTAYSNGSEIQRILLNHLHAEGYTHAADAPVAADLEPTKYGEVHADVFFSSISMIARALNVRSFDLAVNARVVKIIEENRITKGVHVVTKDKQKLFIRANKVVLCASTLETPRILLNSGIQKLPIGHYLVNHSFILPEAIIERQSFPEKLGTLNILLPQTQKNPFQIQLHGPKGFTWYPPYVTKPLRNKWEIQYYAFGRVQSRYENKVFLQKNKFDDAGVPEIDIHFSYSEQDYRVISNMAEALERLTKTLNTPLTSASDQPAICLLPPGFDTHESGTCRMGTDPATSVTDPSGQLHGIEGLYVADNSILPSIGATNPTLTTIALAIRTADHIIRLP